MTEFLLQQTWIEDAIVRVRERGRELTAEAHVVPSENHISVEEVSRTGEQVCGLDPRLAEVTIAPVRTIPKDVARAREAGKA